MEARKEKLAKTSLKNRKKIKHTKKMELENQIKNQFYKALQDSIEKMLNTQPMKDNDIKWFIELCNEIKQRLNSLTPNRKDLQKQLNGSFDTKLIEQMLKNSALEKNDIIHVTNCIFERLMMLCAPVQDKEIMQLKTDIQNEPNFATGIAKLILESNKIIDEIEKLANDFKNPQTND
tara:strand:+ start:1721 stop:2251 length:531 start_codon:yes stop_codon:yes gene_type:complete